MATTKQILGKVMVTNRGGYNSSTTYEILDIVSYNGSSYISKGNDNTDLPTNSASWQLLAQKGDTYEVSETDIKNIAKQITDNANSEFNTNAKARLKEYNDNAKNKTDAYDTNASDKLEDYNKNDTDKLSAYNSNATEKLNDYNNNVNTKLKEYNDNAETKVSEFNSTTNVQKITNLSNEFYRVKDEVLETGEVSDSYIHVEDSALAELQELEIEGVTKQTTTTGKNLLDNSKYNDGTFYSYSNGKITYKQKDIRSLSQIGEKEKITLPPGTYTIKTYLPQNWEHGIQFLTSSGDTISNMNGDVGTFTLTQETTMFIKPLISLSSNAILPFGFNIQIEKGNTSTDYEPYTGGQPSPSPDYPQEIKTITNNLKVTSCGKNLLKNMASSAIINGINFTVNSDGSVLVNGTATDDAILRLVPIATTFSQNLILSPSKKYTLSDSVGNYTDYFTQFVMQNADGTKQWYNTGKDTDISINAIVSLYTATIYVRKGKTLNNVLFKPQIVVKDSTNLFEQYIERQITAKLPEGVFIGKFSDTNKDYVSLEYNKEDGKYHALANKYIGKALLNGTQSIVYSAVTNVDKFVAQFDVRIKANSQLVSNRFTFSANAWSADAENIGAGGASGTYIQIKILQSRLNTVDANGIKEYMKNNPTEAYYQLSTPYKIDLGPIDMPLSYDEVTNIFTDSDLLPTINAKYYRNFITTIQNLQVNNDTLKNELSNIESRLTALENANTSAVDNNPTEESEVTE